MKERKWSYKRSVARSEAVIKRWMCVTLEAAKVLSEEKKALSKREGQNDIPTWKLYSREISLPSYFNFVLREYNSLSRFIENEKAAKKRKTKRGEK